MPRVGPPPLEAGLRFGRLVTTGKFTLRSLPTGDRLRIYECKCDCGGVAHAIATNLKNGNTKSCGCYHKDRNREIQTTHGQTGSKLYVVWAGMMQRCNDSTVAAYKNYGGRGIAVCERWHKFENFRDDMGEPPSGLTLDRIDVHGDYEPSNCRWATRATQARNTTRNHFLTLYGQTYCLSEWAERLGLPISTIKNRLSKKWPVEMILSQRKFHRSETHEFV